MIAWLKYLIAGNEMRQLDRYRRAAEEAAKWHSHIPQARLMAEWIAAFGEGRPCDFLPNQRKRIEAAVRPTFQARVSKWMGECFLPSLYSNMTERGDRLLEEVLELLQSKGYDPRRVGTLVDYVWNRPIGEPSQEVGGVMVTLAGFCWIAGLDMHDAGEAELSRINRPEVMAKVRAKQEAKNALHFDTPLPGAVQADTREAGSEVQE